MTEFFLFENFVQIQPEKRYSISLPNRILRELFSLRERACTVRGLKTLQFLSSSFFLINVKKILNMFNSRFKSFKCYITAPGASKSSI